MALVFPIAFSPANRRLMAPLGMGPGRSRVEVDDDAVRVGMGWSFSADIPRDAIAMASPRVPMPFLGWGVHGWRGRWLVNGTGRGLVRLDLRGDVRARVCGVPVRLRQLWVSVDDPDGLARAIHGA